MRFWQSIRVILSPRSGVLYRYRIRGVYRSACTYIVSITDNYLAFESAEGSLKWHTSRASLSLEQVAPSVRWSDLNGRSAASVMLFLNTVFYSFSHVLLLYCHVLRSEALHRSPLRLLRAARSSVDIQIPKPGGWHRGPIPFLSLKRTTSNVPRG